MCVCARLDVYVHGCGGACGWVRTDTKEEEIKTVRACVTYVFVHPCMLCFRQCEMQKGFRCNVHLSVSVHVFAVFSVRAKVPVQVINH